MLIFPHGVVTTQTEMNLMTMGVIPLRSLSYASDTKQLHKLAIIAEATAAGAKTATGERKMQEEN